MCIPSKVAVQEFHVRIDGEWVVVCVYADTNDVANRTAQALYDATPNAPGLFAIMASQRP